MADPDKSLSRRLLLILDAPCCHLALLKVLAISIAEGWYSRDSYGLGTPSRVGSGIGSDMSKILLTRSTPAVPNCCCSKGLAPYWSNPPFLSFDIRALWRSGLSARTSEYQKLKMVG